MTGPRFTTWALAAGKYLMLAALAAFLLLRYAGAGTGASRTPFREVERAVLAAADLDPMSPADNQMIRRLYRLEPEEYEGMLLYYPTSSMGVEELLLVKLRDPAQGEAARAAAESRVAAQISSFDGYGPAQVETLGRAVIELRGGYLLLVVAEDPGPARQAFLNAL